TVVSVGPYAFTSRCCPAHRCTTSAPSSSPAVTTVRTPVRVPVGITASTAGGTVTWVTPCLAPTSASAYPATTPPPPAPTSRPPAPRIPGARRRELRGEAAVTRPQPRALGRAGQLLPRLRRGHHLRRPRIPQRAPHALRRIPRVHRQIGRARLGHRQHPRHPG